MTDTMNQGRIFDAALCLLRDVLDEGLAAPLLGKDEEGVNLADLNRVREAIEQARTIEIHVAIVHHNHGIGLIVGMSEEEMLQNLRVKYVAPFWERVSEDPCPEDFRETVERYFKLHETEFYDQDLFKFEVPHYQDGEPC